MVESVDMAKKKASPPVSAVQEKKVVKPVRLELSEADHRRLERAADVKGLNKASYARMAVLDRIKADEAGGK
jgi:hypothetical protein